VAKDRRWQQQEKLVAPAQYGYQYIHGCEAHGTVRTAESARGMRRHGVSGHLRLELWQSKDPAG